MTNKCAEFHERDNQGMSSSVRSATTKIVNNIEFEEIFLIKQTKERRMLFCSVLLLVFNSQLPIHILLNVQIIKIKTKYEI